MSFFKTDYSHKYFELSRVESMYVCRLLGDTAAAKTQLAALHPYMVHPWVRTSNVIQLTPTVWGEYHQVIAPTPANKTISYEAAVVDGRCIIRYSGPDELAFKHLNLTPSIVDPGPTDLESLFEEYKARVLSAIF